MIQDLNQRTRDIFAAIVDLHLQTGAAIGSGAVAALDKVNLSPASVRGIMADLEKMGLLYSPHTSAGRIPTAKGLTLYVHGILQLGNLSNDETENLKGLCAAAGHSLPQLLQKAGTALADLSQCATLVAVPKQEIALKHLEFVALAPGRALVVLVFANELIENRVIEIPPGLPQGGLIEAGNYLSYHLVGKTMREARDILRFEVQNFRRELDQLTAKVVQAGLATYAQVGHDQNSGLILRGQANLLDAVQGIEDLERIQHLLRLLESREAGEKLLDAAESAEGVQIFIGEENALFQLSGCSMITAPLRGADAEIVGTLGVIGPSRMNYGRIIPLVDCTARLVAKQLGYDQPGS
jgi:heat-inducible transcriptional repressor